MEIDRFEWLVYPTERTNADGEPRMASVVRVTDAEGARGWARLRSVPADRRGDLREMLEGRDSRQREGIWQEMWDAEFPLRAISLVDAALWDLWGRSEGRPVHALLGTRRRRIPAYVSSHFNVGGGSPEAYAEEALRVRSDGFHGYKIHPTHNEYWQPGRAGGEVETDVDIYRAVREAIGDDPDFALMSDNYHTYHYEQALRVGRLLEELDYRWYESPMWERDRDMPAYRRLCRELEIPVCAPETNDGAHFSRLEWMQAGACDINRIDFAYGGPTSCWMVAEACREGGMPLDLHTGHYWHLQIMGATSAETIPCFEHYATSEEVEFDDGCALIPDEPGLSPELDWDYIEQRRRD